MDFLKFKHAVAKQFSQMQKQQLLRTAVDKDALWETYLGSFPAGSNPIYRERTEHDCSCCRQFIRTVGNIVTIENDKLVSIWDCKVDDPNYQIVANAMAALVKAAPVENVFLHYEKTAGTDKNFEEILGNVKTWEHFFISIPKENYCSNSDIGTKLGESRAIHDVMLRSLTELTLDSVDTVLELIGQNSLYRGEEHKFVLTEFKKLKQAFDLSAEKDLFVWKNMKTIPASVAKIRNTAIGTLLIDLSANVDLETAVTSFERVVAPTNYKRPTSLVTKAMVEQAKAKIEELGLTSALQRRFANINDISINDILFADRQTRSIIAGDVFDEIISSTVNKPKNLDKVEEVTIDRFIKEIIPTAKSIEIMPENRHTNNFVSLIAPVDPTAGTMFKWNNNFSWAYNGDLADSIKERVKQAGGNVTGDLCCRLAWSNFDDLDLHMVEPDGEHIYYGNKRPWNNRGQLDVDMNAGSGVTRKPVENIFYPSKAKMLEGKYRLYVNQFSDRETIDIGFEVEVDFMGTTWNFRYDKPMRRGDNVTVMEFEYSRVNGIRVISSLPSSTASKQFWGINTNGFQKVNVLMMSPNHWEGSSGIGNKHYFFMLEGCENPVEARGFFNEFLKDEFMPHRKVFEIVGSKMKTAKTKEQLSGLGFSSTKGDSVLCKVTGSFTRTIKIVF